MFIAGYFIVHNMPANIKFTDALQISGASGKLNVITTGITNKGFDWKDKYNIFSGLIGGFFLALSYFGTDQSQVGRYLTAKNNTESRLGLLVNGLIKIPMQFLILLLGALLFAYYQFNTQPIFFNKAVSEKVYQSEYGDSLKVIESNFQLLSQQQKKLSANYIDAKENGDNVEINLIKQNILSANAESEDLRQQYKNVLIKADPSVDTNDTNYIFLRFVVDVLPPGLVGLLIAVIFLAAWGSIAAALNSLASCTMIDFYLRFKKNYSHAVLNDPEELKKYHQSKWLTFGWGIFCIVIAEFSTGMGSLIEAVNKYGSLFYGVILGIFLAAFYTKKLNGNAVFCSAVISEALIIVLFVLEEKNIIGLGFLWLNVIGALLVILFGWLFQLLLFRDKK